MLYLIYFLVFICVSQVRTDSRSVSSWYTTQVTERVLPPYRVAYTTLNDRIVQPLVEINTELDNNETQNFLTSLVCASRTVKRKLSLATNASEEIRHSLDQQTIQLVLQISDHQKQVEQVKQKVEQATTDFHYAHKQVTIAESAVHDRQYALNIAEHDLRTAERAVEKAHLCIGRRKRSWGDWWKKRVREPVKKFLHTTNDEHIKPQLRDFRQQVVKPAVEDFRTDVIKPVCSVVNYQGIDNAKDREKLAKTNLNEAQQRLDQYRQDLEEKKNLLSVAQTQLDQIRTQLDELHVRLRDQQKKQVVIVSITTQFKAIEVHLNEILDSSVVLEEAILHLVDFQTVISPLNTIYHEMINNNVITDFQSEISSAMASKATENLHSINEKMIFMPLNEIALDDATIVCV